MERREEVGKVFEKFMEFYAGCQPRQTNPPTLSSTDRGFDHAEPILESMVPVSWNI